MKYNVKCSALSEIKLSCFDDVCDSKHLYSIPVSKSDQKVKLIDCHEKSTQLHFKLIICLFQNSRTGRCSFICVVLKFHPEKWNWFH